MRRAMKAALPAIVLGAAAFALGTACGGSGEDRSAGDGQRQRDGGPPDPARDGSIPGEDGARDDDAGEGAAKAHPVNVEHACSASLRVKVAVLEDAVVRVHYVSGGAEQP